MLRIGCTGGIGAGKSTAAALLAAKGAAVIDADEIARQTSAPGGVAFGAIIERFGPRYVTKEGRLDRGALAQLVFSEPEQLRELEAIVHPMVDLAIVRQLAELEGRVDVVILDIALLVERGGRERHGLDGILVVDAPEDLCVERLISFRGLDEQDARRRIAAQLPRDARLRAADFVIMNIGSLEELASMVDEAWRWIERLASESSS